MTLGDKVSGLRKQHNMTQEQLAEQLGVSRQTVSKWESNLAYPETEKLIRMCRMFHCSTDYLLLDEIDGFQASETAFETDSAENTPGNSAEKQQENNEGITVSLSFGKRLLLKERKSEKTLWGMPLWHIAKNARGVVAVGLNARGIIAIGLKARGIVSLGVLFLGLFSSGVLSLGLIAVGVFALGLLASGCFAAGVVAVGAISFGILAVGAIAVGQFSVGALAVGKYFAIGDHAHGMIAIGGSEATGSLFEKVGKLTAEEIAKVKQCLDEIVPGILSWVKELIKSFW